MKIPPLSAAALMMRSSSGSSGPVKLIFITLAPASNAQLMPFSSWNEVDSAAVFLPLRKARTLSNLAAGATPISSA
jgi:hypothetical protein